MLFYFCTIVGGRIQVSKHMFFFNDLEIIMLLKPILSGIESEVKLWSESELKFKASF